MRAFVILSVIAVASAGRLGYNYQAGVSGTNDFVSSGTGLSPVVALGNGQGLGGDFGGQAQGSSVSFGQSSGFGNGFNFGSSGQSLGSLGSESVGSGSINFGSSGSVGGGTNRVIDGGLTKEYFIYSAPEEQAQQGHSTQSVSTVIKKNLRVIFIKAPENNGAHNAALQVAKQATEDRTAIYVLSKEPDVSEIATQVQQISENVRAKPEVRFIKYRTAQDIQNAQRTIQQQYESLGGSSQSSDEGVAPVLNFASPAESVQHSAHAQGHGLGGSGSSSLFASGSSISSSSSPALNFGSASEQSSQSVDLGNIGSASQNVGVKAQNEYLPPAVKK